MRIFELRENQEQWIIRQTNQFKKGLKKYQTDKVVVKNLAEVVTLLSQGTKPMELPKSYNPHPLTGSHKGYFNLHLKGQKIILVLKPDYQNKLIELYFLGTHQRGGISRD